MPGVDFGLGINATAAWALRNSRISAGAKLAATASGVSGWLKKGEQAVNLTPGGGVIFWLVQMGPEGLRERPGRRRGGVRSLLRRLRR